MIAIRGSPARASLTRGSAPSLPYAPGAKPFPTRRRLPRHRFSATHTGCRQQSRTVLNTLYYSAFICHSGRVST
ncbi:hypothetical protein AMC87_CH01320 [Rhizobium phaseoli]|nr:hypothetical protein AMC87_CH01320 [Rhizobium phaseoli]